MDDAHHKVSDCVAMDSIRWNHPMNGCIYSYSDGGGRVRVQKGMLSNIFSVRLGLRSCMQISIQTEIYVARV